MFMVYLQKKTIKFLTEIVKEAIDDGYFLDHPEVTDKGFIFALKNKFERILVIFLTSLKGFLLMHILKIPQYTEIKKIEIKRCMRKNLGCSLRKRLSLSCIYRANKVKLIKF